LYLSLVFDGFTGSDFANINVCFNLMSTFALMVLMPILSIKLKIHDAMLQFIVMSLEVIGFENHSEFLGSILIYFRVSVTFSHLLLASYGNFTWFK